MNNLSDKRIFIIDDDPYWTALLSEMLKVLGHTEIYTFENGKDSLEKLHLNPQMVFLDYQMDDMDGLEVLKRIKEYYPGIKVVFCTAHEDLGIAVNAMEYGSLDYLLKNNVNITEISQLGEHLHEQKN